MSEDKIHTLITNRTDAEIAKELKAKVLEAYKPLIALADEAATHGMAIQAGIGMGPFGKFVIQNCQIIKTFTE